MAGLVGERMTPQCTGCASPHTRQHLDDLSRMYNISIAERIRMSVPPSRLMDAGSTDLSDLLQRAKRYEPQALSALHEMFYPLVFRYVAYRIDDLQACEDISSEVFLRLLKSLKREELDIRSLRAWLLGTAHHLVQDYYRWNYRHPVSPLEHHQHLPNGHNPAEEAENRLSHQQVRVALQRLTADQQHVLTLRFSLELSLQETAQTMNKSVEAVKVLQFRALAALRRQLEGSR